MQATALARFITTLRFRSVQMLTTIAIAVSLTVLGGCQHKGGDEDGSNASTEISKEDRQRAKAHYLNAESYVAQGQLRPAMVEARNTLYTNPNDIEAAALIAKMLVKAGDGYGASQQIEVLLANDESNTAYQLLQVEATILQNRYRSALALLEKAGAPESDEDRIKYYLLETEAYSRAGKMDKAIASANKVLKLDAKNASALVWIAKAHFERDNSKGVVKYTDLAIATGRDNLDLWLWQGKLASLREDFPAAEEAYSRALGHVQKLDILTSEKYLALNGMIQALKGQGRTSAAAIFGKQLQESKFGELTDTYQSAIKSFQQGKYNDAELAFKEILEGSPHHAASGTVLAMLKYSQGELAEAEKYLEEALKGNLVPIHTYKLLAIARLKLGRAGDALTIINNALAEHPIDEELLALRGAALVQLDRKKEARDTFHTALKINKLNPAALFMLGSLEANDGNWDRAVELYERLARANPNNLNALRGLLGAKSSQEDMAAATRVIEELAAEFKDKAGPQLMLAAIAVQSKDLENGLKYAKKAYDIQGGPQASGLYGRMILADAIQLAQQKKLAASIKRALEARKLNPSDLAATRHLAKIQMVQGSVGQAVEYVDWYTKQFPDNTAAYILKGDIYAANSRASEAINAYEESWNIKRSGNLGMKLFRAKASLSNVAAALKPLQKWKEDEPKIPVARLTLAMAYQEANKKTQAISEYEELVEGFPANALVLNNLAWLYYETKNTKAMDTAEKAYEMAPNSPAIADTYGWILVNSGKAKEAVSILQKASSAAPDNEEILQHYIKALEQSGDSAGAAAARRNSSTQ